jgi:hypothetical protein
LGPCGRSDATAGTESLALDAGTPGGRAGATPGGGTEGGAEVRSLRSGAAVINSTDGTDAGFVETGRTMEGAAGDAAPTACARPRESQEAPLAPPASARSVTPVSTRPRRRRGILATAAVVPSSVALEAPPVTASEALKTAGIATVAAVTEGGSEARFTPAGVTRRWSGTADSGATPGDSITARSSARISRALG